MVELDTGPSTGALVLAGRLTLGPTAVLSIPGFFSPGAGVEQHETVRKYTGRVTTYNAAELCPTTGFQDITAEMIAQKLEGIVTGYPLGVFGSAVKTVDGFVQLMLFLEQKESSVWKKPLDLPYTDHTGKEDASLAASRALFLQEFKEHVSSDVVSSIRPLEWGSLPKKIPGSVR